MFGHKSTLVYQVYIYSANIVLNQAFRSRKIFAYIGCDEAKIINSSEENAKLEEDIPLLFEPPFSKHL